MTTNTTDGETPNRPAQQVELWDRQTVLAFYGGTKPINVSTLYKGMASGRYPKPVNVGPNTVRWIAGECRTTLHRMVSERDGRKRLTRRGDNRLHHIT